MQRQDSKLYIMIFLSVNIEVVGNENNLSAFYSETGANDYEIKAVQVRKMPEIKNYFCNFLAQARLAVITYMGNFNSTTSSELKYITY